MHPLRKIYLPLFTLFLVSVIVRIPTLNRPLSKHHEFCTAVALRVMQIWNEAGISAYSFNPVMTYPNQADQHINNYASGSGKMQDSQGRFYYISHPPLAYYVPFFLFKILLINPDVLPIQLFNLSVHFFCGFGVFLILQILGCANRSALIGFAVYLFSPGTLWFHSNIYMSDILVQVFFIYGVLFTLKYWETGKRRWMAAGVITSFFMTYTSWLGVFFMISAVVMFLLKRKYIQAVALVCASAGALMLTSFQYAQIAGWDTLGEEWLARFSERSGWTTAAFIRSSAAIAGNYITSYLPLLAAILLLLLLNRRKLMPLLNGKICDFILISILPVLLLHAVLLNYSGHDFTSLYGGLFLCGTAGLVFHFFLQEKIKFGFAVTAMLIFLGIAQYYFINRPGEHSWKDERYAYFQEMGYSIASHAGDDEVIFILGPKPTPEIVFYAGRNIRQVSDEADAIRFLKDFNRTKGVLLTVEDTAVVMSKRINVTHF